MSGVITIGTRGSKLAVVQAESVVSALKEQNPEIQLRLVTVVTEGDRNRQLLLEGITESGIFVKEIEKTLLDGRIDIAVHSLKDMPVGIPPEFHLAAVTQRVDVRDVLVSNNRKLSELPSGAMIGTGSRRRAVQLKAFRSDLDVRSMRGNVETRISKVASGEFDGIILAAAGVIRLGMQKKITEYLPLDDFLPSPGQGAIGIETRCEDRDMIGLVTSVNHQPTNQSVTAERAFLGALGGGCREPIAAVAIVSDNTLEIRGMVADAKGEKMLQSTLKGNAGEPVEVGRRLAEKMREMGADDLLTKVEV
jgi:hydroxymethylbilane synthase